MYYAIFISYRRVDSKEFSLNLHKAICQKIDKSRVFFDVSGDIYVGEDFEKKIGLKIRDSDAVLSIVGGDFVGRRSDKTSRIMDSGDWVARELGLAHSLGKLILPVVLPGVSMPGPSELPEALQFYPKLNAFFFSENDFLAQVDRLLVEINRVTVDRESEIDESRRAEDARRKLAEQRLQQRETEASLDRERRVTIDRISKSCGINPGNYEHRSIFLAELENANWKRIMSMRESGLLEEHIKCFQGGTVRDAVNQLDDLTFASFRGVGSRDYEDHLDDYLNKFPDGRHAEEARNNLKNLHRYFESQRLEAEARQNNKAEKSRNFWARLWRRF